jgi:pimeloyl-ACP methyl ester carboxylesterase
MRVRVLCPPVLVRASGNSGATFAGTRFDEIRNDPAIRKLDRDIRGPCLKSLSQPAGMRNDWETMETGAFASAQEVKCPTLVIYAPADLMVPQRHADWPLSAIPGARACELHAGGHLIWIGKDAERMQRERLAFLREHAPRRHPSRADDYGGGGSWVSPSVAFHSAYLKNISSRN